MKEVTCDNLDESIERYASELGYRLDMIKPADAPREAVLSVPPTIAGGLSSASQSKVDGEREKIRLVLVNSDEQIHPPATANGTDWVTGRAGMEYRDLIADRLGGKMIASHIRLTKGGEVPDYVHYHKIGFQMIYCKRGRIKVVYEDQGPPFWLETGDSVLQPTEIRHRVLYADAGAEVVEVSMPAEHETWVEHDITLPTSEIKPDRDFGGQKFCRFIESDADWRSGDSGSFQYCDTGIAAASDRAADVKVLKWNADQAGGPIRDTGVVTFYFVLSGELEIVSRNGEVTRIKENGSILIDPNSDNKEVYQTGLKLLVVSIN